MSTPLVPTETRPTPGDRHDWRTVVLGTLLAFTASLAVVTLVGAIIRGLGADDGSNTVDTRVLDG